VKRDEEGTPAEEEDAVEDREESQVDFVPGASSCIRTRSSLGLSWIDDRCSLKSLITLQRVCPLRSAGATQSPATAPSCSLINLKIKDRSSELRSRNWHSSADRNTSAVRYVCVICVSVCVFVYVPV